MNNVRNVIRRAAEINQVWWDKAKAELPPTATDKEIFARCEAGPVNHEKAVAIAVHELQLPAPYVTLVFALRKSWPEALRFCAEVEAETEKNKK